MSRRPGSAGAAAARFARRLRDRFRRRPVRAAVPMLLLRHRARPIPARRVPQHHVSARITVSMPVHVQMSARTLVHRTAIASGPTRVVVTTPPVRVAPAVAVVVREHVRHTARVVTPLPRPVPVAGRVEQPVPPVPRTVLPAVRSTGPPVPDAPGARPPAAVVVDALGSEPRSLPCPVAGELDITRLTEQVVRRIDQRIVAQRERLGRR